MASFDLGAIVATPGALSLLSDLGTSPRDLLRRHAAGDWGEIDPADSGLNERSLRDGSRLLSVYKLSPAATVWLITEAADDEGHRAATTLLLPSEY